MVGGRQELEELQATKISILAHLVSSFSSYIYFERFLTTITLSYFSLFIKKMLKT